MSSLQMVDSRTSFFLLFGLAVLCFVLPARALADDRGVNQRSIGDYRRDVKAFMKLSKSKDEQIQRNAVFNLCALHHELVTDSRFRTSTQVQSFRVVVANRLEDFSKQQKKKFKKQRSAELKRARANQSRPQPKARNEELAYGAEAGAKENLETKTESAETDESQAVFQSAVQSYDSLAQFSGGPAQVFDYAGGRMGAPWEGGLQLVNLIQTTIDPDSWRDSGGNGAIQYYQPGRVLVINASQRVHELTEDLLWKLRANF